MNSKYEEIKSLIPMKNAMERYGIIVNKNGFALCPFHQEDTPSMKVYESSFYCFGCGTGGDVISFAARLFHLSNAQAVIRLCDDFGIGPGSAVCRPTRPKIAQERDKFRKDYLDKCSEYRSLSVKLQKAKGFERAEIESRLAYLDYYFEVTAWR